MTTTILKEYKELSGNSVKLVKNDSTPDYPLYTLITVINGKESEFNFRSPISANESFLNRIETINNI